MIAVSRQRDAKKKYLSEMKEPCCGADCKETATQVCVDCQRCFMCPGCAIKHQQWRCFQNHTIIEVTEALDLPETKHLVSIA